MDKNDGMSPISRLLFELSISNNETSYLNILLERLFAILDHYYNLQLQPHGAILLLNPRGRYFQVAPTLT